MRNGFEPNINTSFLIRFALHLVFGKVKSSSSLFFESPTARGITKRFKVAQKVAWYSAEFVSLPF